MRQETEARLPSMTVMLVDADPLVRVGLRCLVEAMTEAKVIGDAADAAEAVELAVRLKPNLVLRGRTGEPDGGAGVFRHLTRAAPETRTIVLGDGDDPVEAQAAFASGAAGYIVRSEIAEHFGHALREVAAGRLFLDPSTGGRLAAALAANGSRSASRGGAGGEAITERERQVLTLLSHGLTNREVAARLGISYRTVERHRTSLARKLRRPRRSQLVEYAREHHLD